MICIKLFESWLPFSSAALMLHPLDITFSHEKGTWTVQSFTNLNSHPRVLYQWLENNVAVASFTLTAKRNLCLLFQNYAQFHATPIILYNYYSGIISSSLPGFSRQCVTVITRFLTMTCVQVDTASRTHSDCVISLISLLCTFKESLTELWQCKEWMSPRLQPSCDPGAKLVHI